MDPSPEPLPTFQYLPRAQPSRSAQIRIVAWVALVTTLLGGTLCCFTVLFQPGYGAFGGNLFIGWIGLGIALLLMAWLLATTPADAIVLSTGLSWVIILGGSAVMHMTGFVRVSPELSEDVFRYRLDARLAAAGYPVYQTSNAALLRPKSTPAETRIDDMTPHLGLPTIYPPAAQVVFRAADYLGNHFRPAGSTRYPMDWIGSWNAGRPRWLVAPFAPAMRFLAVIASLATAVLLLVGLRWMNRSPWYAALFTWNPLTLMETSVQSHVDVFGVFLVVLCIVLVLRQRFTLAMIALAIAAGIKPHAVVLAPVILLASGRLPTSMIHGRRSAAIAQGLRSACLPAIAFAGALFVVYLPILLSRENLSGWYQTVQVYSASWEANGSVYELITGPFRLGDGRDLEKAKLISRLLGGLGLAATLYLAIRNRLPPADAAYWLMLVPLMLAPVVYPWYLLWGLAVVPLLQQSRGWTLLTWSATSVLSYQLLREPAWRLPPGWLIAEYVPVYAVLAGELWSLRSTSVQPYGDGCAATAPSC